MPDRPLRYCDICGELDDHPRHVITVPDGTPEAVVSSEFLANLPPGPPEAGLQLLSTTIMIRHLNCCAEAGCEVCQATEKETKGLRGAKLTARVTNAPVEVDTTGLSVGGLPNG